MVNQFQPPLPKALLIPRCLQLLAQDWGEPPGIYKSQAASTMSYVLPIENSHREQSGTSVSVKPKPWRLLDKPPNFQGPEGSLNWGWGLSLTTPAHPLWRAEQNKCFQRENRTVLVSSCICVTLLASAVWGAVSLCMCLRECVVGR